ncbi:MAG: FAD-binding protein [Actinomycetota bacterium]|nr:FAD-binding protein [Actinomycetota bacterium]
MALDEPALRDLERLLGERLTSKQAVREHHGRDESPLPPASPEAVAFPISTTEVSQILQICSRGRVPVIPFGAGTSLEGHVLATRGGLCLDLSLLDQIVELNVDDLDVTVEAGVTRKQLDERLRREGLFFPVDPGADATLGGMVATGASGTTTVRYGAMRENVLSLEVVLPDGRVVRTGHRARKSSAGYDLTRLFLGSEGTLGVITRATLRVYGTPEAISAAVCHFESVDDAVRTVIATLQMGVPVARIEFLDEFGMKAVDGFSGLDFPAAPTLFFEFHGSPAAVAEQAQTVAGIAAEYGSMDFRSALDHEERAKLWRARHDAFYASLALRPGSRAITTDVCVPISRLAECILETRRDVEQNALTTTTVGHVGDGNFHLMIMVDPDDEAELKVAADINRRLVERALEMDGTCTGEHGVGLRKIDFLSRELGEGVEVMKSIKRAIDPLNIMNPGKVLSLTS